MNQNQAVSGKPSEFLRIQLLFSCGPVPFLSPTHFACNAVDRNYPDPVESDWIVLGRILPLLSVFDPKRVSRSFGFVPFDCPLPIEPRHFATI